MTRCSFYAENPLADQTGGVPRASVLEGSAAVAGPGITRHQIREKNGTN